MTNELLSFSPRSFSGILAETIAVYRHRLMPLLALAAFMAVFGVLAWLPFTALIDTDFYGDLTAATRGPEVDQAAAQRAAEALLGRLPAVVGYGLLAGSIVLALFVIGWGAYFCVLGAHYAGRRPSLAWAVAFSLRRWLSAVIAAILAGLMLLGIWTAFVLATLVLVIAVVVLAAVTTISTLSFLGFLLLVPLILGGVGSVVFLSIKWSLVWQVIFLEGLGPRRALSRSWYLLEGNWWRVLGIFALTYVVVGIASLVINALVGQWPVGVAEGIRLNLFSTAAAAVLGIPIGPITPIIAFLVYMDLRARKEGFGQEHLRQSLHL